MRGSELTSAAQALGLACLVALVLAGTSALSSSDHLGGQETRPQLINHAGIMRPPRASLAGKMDAPSAARSVATSRASPRKARKLEGSRYRAAGTSARSTNGRKVFGPVRAGQYAAKLRAKERAFRRRYLQNKRQRS